MFYLPYEVTPKKFNFVFIFLIAATTILLSACGGKTVTKEFVPPVYPPPPEKPRFIYERTFRTSFDVKEITAADRFKQAVTGTIGSGFGLEKPYGVAAYKGRVYVTDTVQRAIFMFDVPGRNFKIIGTEGPGTITKPIGIAVSRLGEVFVTDHTSKRVMVYDKDGKFLRALGGAQYLRKPSGVAVSPDGHTLYIVDTGGVDDQEHHRFTMWNAQTGEFIKTVGRRGTGEGEFNLPLQAATGPDGTLYVVDGGNFRVQAFTPDGKFIRSIGSIGRRSGQFSRPKGIGTDNDGNIYVVDTAFGNFQIFNQEGRLLLFVGDRGYQGMPGQYMLPAGLTVDEDGRVYLVDQYFKKVDVFRPADLGPDDGWLSTKREHTQG
jgi:DNA-binding beta-propeller fold protein YncE